MIFDKSSDVTIVLTSCGRFDLLKTTLLSLDEFNTYPTKKVIITEDSGSQDVMKAIPQHWLEYTEVIINNPKLGQIKSIDKAYSFVDTKYIFHCEDDWEFHREGFIEDSKLILENDINVIQVWIRDYESDIKKHYDFHFKGQEIKFGNLVSYKLGNSDPKQEWYGFSFNPGLRRKADYEIQKPYYIEGAFAINIERFLSIFYHRKGMYAVFLKESAVKHIGWDSHIFSKDELIKIEEDKRRKRRKKIKHILIGFLLGSVITLFATF